MISMRFNIVNPWTKDVDKVTPYFYTEPRLSKNWAMCLQIERNAIYDIFSLELDLSWRGKDHAGPMIEINMLGYMFSFKIYNINHWDYEKGTWTKHVNESST